MTTEAIKNPSDFDKWLSTAKKGDKFTYHVGDLNADSYNNDQNSIKLRNLKEYIMGYFGEWEEVPRASALGKGINDRTLKIKENNIIDLIQKVKEKKYVAVQKKNKKDYLKTTVFEYMAVKK